MLKGFGKEKFEKFVNNMDMDDDTTEINLDEFLLKAYAVTERLLLVRYAAYGALPAFWWLLQKW